MRQTVLANVHSIGQRNIQPIQNPFLITRRTRTVQCTFVGTVEPFTLLAAAELEKEQPSCAADRATATLFPRCWKVWKKCLGEIVNKQGIIVAITGGKLEVQSSCSQLQAYLLLLAIFTRSLSGIFFLHTGCERNTPAGKLTGLL